MSYYCYRIYEVRDLAYDYGWYEVQYNPMSAVLGFCRGNERINVYYNTGTVGTCTDHPRLGKTQLFRRNVPFQVLEDIFHNIRTHTGRGYYRRHPEGAPEPSLQPLGWWGAGNNSLFEHFDPDATPLVALGDGYFAMTSNGEPCWEGNLPIGFTNKLRGRQRHLPRVDFVAFGPHNEYFVQFVDGKSQWSGPMDFTDALKNHHTGFVHFVAFAPNGGYYIAFEDGLHTWSNLPRTLHHQLNGRQKSLPGVDHISIGPYGEWYVRFQDGDWRCRGHNDGCEDQINELLAQGHEVKHIAFGHNSTWLISYS